MSTLSVPLTPNLEEFINDMIKRGEAETKAEVVRKALRKMEEEEVINSILEAERDARAGKVFRGDIRKLIKKF